MAEPRHFSRRGLVTTAIVIAVVCVAGLVVLVRDRWDRPEPPQVSRTTTTGAAGAMVLPTDPKLAVEPTPAPPPVQPAKPD